MDINEFCSIVRKYKGDEEHDEVKYREFAEKLRSNNIGDDVLMTGTLLISNQEKTHKDFWIGVYMEYCNGEMR